MQRTQLVGGSPEIPVLKEHKHNFVSFRIFHKPGALSPYPYDVRRRLAFHHHPQNPVDPRLVSLSLALEPRKNIGIQPNRQLLFSQAAKQPWPS
jgi:hypothetical protein